MRNCMNSLSPNIITASDAHVFHCLKKGSHRLVSKAAMAMPVRPPAQFRSSLSLHMCSRMKSMEVARLTSAFIAVTVALKSLTSSDETHPNADASLSHGAPLPSLHVSQHDATPKAVAVGGRCLARRAAFSAALA